MEEAVKGPPTRIAFDADGNPTRAAEAFAAKQGVTMNELQREMFAGEECLATTVFKGASTRELLAEILPPLVLGLSGPRFMRWGDYDVRFARPIRWIVSLWDDAVSPLAIGPVQADRLSRASRMLGDVALSIPSAAAYEDVLATEGQICVNQDARRERIAALLAESAQAQGGALPEGPEYDALMQTVATLVESPSIVAGSFDEAFLAIPKPVITTVMASHQKYFPIERADGELMARFLAVSNGRPKPLITFALATNACSRPACKTPASSTKTTSSARWKIA